GVSRIFAGPQADCAIAQDHLTCWGKKPNGIVDKPPKTLTRNTQVAIGTRHICALAGGELYCWGDNRNGQINIPKP
ncbi:hypothetical protein ACSTLX_25445, partial [Vibrio parahaemolyticus]